MIPAFLILYIVSCLCSALGFYKFVWFLSVGYGLSIAVEGIVLLMMFKTNLTLISIILCILCIIYGVRLSMFLFIREKSSGYANNIKPTNEKKMPIFTKLGIWLPCALIYVCDVSPILYRLQNKKNDIIFGLIGIIFSVTGVILEALADQQKTNFKKKDPKAFCDVGLFKIVRCPNYLGEITFWLGIFISGLPIYQGILQWIAAVFAIVSITFIMISAASNIEKKHEKNYGNNEKYRDYAKKTPILIPFVPIYSLMKK